MYDRLHARIQRIIINTIAIEGTKQLISSSTRECKI